MKVLESIKNSVINYYTRNPILFEVKHNKPASEKEKIVYKRESIPGINKYVQKEESKE